MLGVAENYMTIARGAEARADTRNPTINQTERLAKRRG
jgi:hypothetical protein